MKISVILAALLIALLGSILNNTINPHAIDWVGSPEVLEKPASLESTGGWLKGFQAGLKSGWRGMADNGVYLLSGLSLVIIVSALLIRFQWGHLRYILFALIRLGLGIMFLAAAWPKVSNPEAFAGLVAQYQFLPELLVNPFSLYLPVLEIITAFGLIFSAWSREFMALIGILMIMFIVALGQAVARELGITCGCFDIEGATDVGGAWFSLIRDLVLMPLILWVFWSGDNRFIWELKPKKRHSPSLGMQPPIPSSIL